MKKIEFTINVIEDGGYVSVYDYLKLVQSKNEKLHSTIKAISNHEGMLDIYFDTNLMYYRDAALLADCFTELGDNGDNVSFLNLKDQVINIIGNSGYSRDWKYAPLSEQEYNSHNPRSANNL